MLFLSCVCAYAIVTTPVPALTLLLRMSQDLSENDEKQSHPYILLHMDESIGVPAVFANGWPLERRHYTGEGP